MRGDYRMSCSDFSGFGLSRSTLDALAAKNITKPTPIQAAAIPLLMSGDRDVLGQARTGTGKTAAFGIPIIECIKTGGKSPKALILTPTRELCMQVAAEIKSLAGDRRLFVAAVYGGASIEVQLRSLKRGVDIVVGTPGRVQDMIDRGALSLDEIMFSVLDEADEMLDMGFVEDIEAILSVMPEDRRTLMFSATMPEEILSIAERFMRDCEVIRVDAEPASLDQIDQYGYELHREDKVEALIRLIHMAPDMYALIFCRTRADVDELVDQLAARHCRVEALHGEISQAQRTKVIRQFKDGSFRILVATDVAARGIDVAGLTHVINYSLPQSAEIYIHRIGRTGRAGRKGEAVSFITPGERKRLAEIEKELNAKLEIRELPSPEELVIANKNELVQALSGCELSPEYLDFASELLDATTDADALVAAMLHVGFGNRFLESAYPYIGKVRPKRERGERGGADKKSGRKPPEHNDKFVRLFVGKGKHDGMTPQILLEMIFNAVRITSRRLGKITCTPKNSFIEVPASLANKIVSGVNGHTHSNLMRIDEKAAKKKTSGKK